MIFFSKSVTVCRRSNTTIANSEKNGNKHKSLSKTTCTIMAPSQFAFNVLINNNCHKRNRY